MKLYLQDFYECLNDKGKFIIWKIKFSQFYIQLKYY
jgi:hypothetical protein